MKDDTMPLPNSFLNRPNDSSTSIYNMVAIVNFLPDATFVIDKNHRVVAWNQAMEELTGIDAQDILGKGEYEYAVPFYGTRRPILIDLILDPDEEYERNLLITRDREALITETPTPNLKGKEAFLWGKATLLYDSQGNIIGAIESIRDITERQRAEIALKNSEQRLADIIDFLPDATFVIDKDHQVIAWNRAMEDMLGVKAEDMLGKGDYEYGIPFYGVRAPILIDRILEPDEDMEKHYSLIIERDKEVLIVETPALTVKGKETYLWGKATLLYDSQGDIIGAIESIRDITERKQAEVALKNSEQRLADIIDFLPDATFVIDAAHQVIAWNRAMEDMTGVEAEKILGKGDYLCGAILYGVKRPVMADLILQPDEEVEKSYSYVALDKGTLLMEKSFSDLRGKEAFLWGKATLLYDSQGNVTGAIESIRDIIDRKQAEVALKNSEQRWADIINFLPDATFVIDKDHQVIAWNRAMEELSGVKAEDMLGQGDYAYSIPFYGVRGPILIDRMLEPDENMEKYYSLIIEHNKEVLIVETPALMVKEKETYLWGKATLLYDSQGNIIGAIESIRDVTDRKKSELDKLEAQERAARAENLASLGLITTELAHAIKQPLNSLMITIDSILYWYDQGRDLNRADLIEDLQKALVKSARINEILEHMRAFIRNERDGEPTPCNINLSVENALDIMKAHLFSHGIEIQLELAPDLPLVLGYENRIEEIISNLIENAMQSLERVSRNKVKTITCISRLEHNVILEICDNGIGISPENMNKIFEPFFSTKEGQGMGMGLFIAKSIITTLNGRIQCTSNKDQTTFRIELPPYQD